MDVLIVDNEPAFAELLAARLELQGYSARSAGSGEEALKKLNFPHAQKVAADSLHHADRAGTG